MYGEIFLPLKAKFCLPDSPTPWATTGLKDFKSNFKKLIAASTAEDDRPNSCCM